MNEAWYYAKDGSPQGPVERSLVEDLYRRGQIAPDGLVWKEGTPDWVMASTVFGAAPAGSAVATSSPAPVRTRGGIDLESCLRDAWAVFRVQWPLLLLGSILFFALSFTVQIPMQVGEWILNGMGHKVMSPAWWTLVGVYSLLSVLVTAPLGAGFMLFHLEALRDKPRVETIFAGFRQCWVQLVLGSLATTLLVFAGFVLLIIPGIYLGVCYAFALPLIIDRKLEFWEAMELSRKTVHAQWFSVLALLLLAGVVMMAGVVLCCVGIVGTVPLGYLVLMQGYRQLFSSAASA